VFYLAGGPVGKGLMTVTAAACWLASTAAKMNEKGTKLEFISIQLNNRQRPCMPKIESKIVT
jgi:hypothetical protein